MHLGRAEKKDAGSWIFSFSSSLSFLWHLVHVYITFLGEDNDEEKDNDDDDDDDLTNRDTFRTKKTSLFFQMTLL